MAEKHDTKPTDTGTNRTGIAASPIDSKRMIAGAEQASAAFIAESLRQGSAYDPDTNEWRRLADVPVLSSGLTTWGGPVWTGQTILTTVDSVLARFHCGPTAAPRSGMSQNPGHKP